TIHWIYWMGRARVEPRSSQEETMNTAVRALPRFNYNDDAKNEPLACPCGFAAPGEIVEYYRFYHVLGCMRCRAALALVDHPVPAAPRRTGVFPRWDAAQELAA